MAPVGVVLTVPCLLWHVTALQKNKFGEGHVSDTLVQIQDLWSGRDLKGTAFDELVNESTWSQSWASSHASGSSRHSERQKEPTQPTRFVLLGPMDSGTHLLAWMLLANFPEQMKSACGLNTEGCRWLWKHSLNADGIYGVLDNTSGEPLQNTVAVAVVRSPIATVVGWRRDPWDLEDCVNRPWKMMNKPCHARLYASRPNRHQGMGGDDLVSLNFSSTMDVYNRYLNTYTRLKNDGKLKAMAIVAYEDLVLSPSIIVHRVASLMGWQAPRSVRLAFHTSKDGGSSRNEAIHKLKERLHLKEAHEGLPLLCRSLNVLQIKHLKEGTYTDSPRSFVADCEPVLHRLDSARFPRNGSRVVTPSRQRK